MKKLLLPLAALCFGLYASNSSAQIFTIDIKDFGSISDSTLQGLLRDKIMEVQNDVNKDLPSAPPERLMEGMANSSVMAGKGIGSDYASNMEVFLIGAGIGVGADLEKDSNTDSEISGLGVAPGIVLGANLGFMDTARILGMETNRLNAYVNFMSYSHDQTFGESKDETEAGIDMTSMGVHFRYDWIKGKGTKLLGWGGVKFHFGYEFNKNDIKFSSKINEEIDEDFEGNHVEGTITGRPTATIQTTTHSIPLELSTDVQLLYFLSLYGGVGVDFNFGSAKGKGDLNAENSELNCTSGPACTGPDPVIVEAKADIDATGNVKSFTSRAFAGLQFNLPYVRIFGQVDKSLGNDLIGATAGVRFVY